MSWKIANLCADRIFGSAARKQIIMFLADKASDDGSGIWCSKGTIQRHTELGESTVKRTITDFLREGILIETGRRPCKNGFTVIYRIVLDRVMALESSAEPDEGTGSTVDPVQRDPGRGSRVDGVRVQGGPQTTLKPSINHLRASARRRRWMIGLKEDLGGLPQGPAAREGCERGRDCRGAGRRIDPDDLLRAVQAYATESAGFTRSKVCFSTTGSPAAAGSASSKWRPRSERRGQRWPPITTPGWPHGCATAARCANTSPPRR
jgi:hypothetical protein